MKNNTFLWILSILFLCNIGFAQEQFEYLIQSNTTDKTFEELSAIGEAYYLEKGTARGTGYKPFKRWQDWGRRNLDVNGRIISQADALEELKKFIKQDQLNKSVTGTFTEMGPLSAVNTSTWSSNIGRLTSIDVHDSNPNHILVSTPGGGVWHSLDFGTTWVPLFDQEAVISILSANINHANANDYVIGTAGGGIYRSIDQGATWTASAGTTNDWFIDIKRHPTNAAIMFATGRFFGETWRSSDSGASWAVVDNQVPEAHDLEFKPGDPTTIYISGNGFIRKSTDTGLTWAALTSGGTWGTSAGNTIMMAVSPAAPNELHVIEEQAGGLQGLYKSTNDGMTFTTTFTYDGTNNYMGYEQDDQDGQGPRDMDIAVSPNNTNIIHIAGTELWSSTNGGTTFTKTGSWNLDDPEPFIHADVDQLVYHGNRFFAATDGGIYFSDDDAVTWTDKSQGLGIRQFYRIGASQTDADRVGGGSQDNGTGIVKSGVWNDWVGADGMETFVDWSNAQITYGNTQFGGLYKSINGGVTTTGVTQNPGVGMSGFQGAWVTPTEQDPMVANTLYQAKLQVFKSTDGAQTWNAISAFGAGLIQEMKIAPSDNQTIYIAFSHDIYKTVDGGTNWTDITPTIIYSGATYIAVHPTDPTRVSLTLSGADEKVIESTDGGTTWVNISSNLPAIGSQCVMYENDSQDAMYVGMNPGLYFKDNTTAGDWSLVNAAMPNVSITEVEARNGILYIGTYGRGLWKIDLVEGFVAEYCLSPAVIIPDGDPVTGVSSTITLAPTGAITDVNIDVDILHEFVGDLKATLTHGGVSVVLFDQPGVPVTSFGCSGNNIDCTFDDESTNGVVEGVCVTTMDPVYTGDYNPAEVLSAFDGMEASGDWVLTLTDATTPDQGILQDWCVDVTVEEVCNDNVVVIPDGNPTGVTSTITLVVGGMISDVNVDIDITHAWVGDVSATLKHVESGTTVVLFDRPGYTGAGDGCQDDNYDCTFDDQSTNGVIEGICTGADPAYSGTYNPAELLSAFNGEDRAGTWELLVVDATGPDEGTLTNWCLNITTCPGDYAGVNKLTGPLTTDNTYGTSGDLESEQMISGPVNVTYSADGSIELLEGFSTETESTFTTTHDGCPE